MLLCAGVKKIERFILHNPFGCATFAADFCVFMAQSNEYNLQSLAVDRLQAGSYEFDCVLDTSYFSAVEKSDILSGQVQAHFGLKVGEMVLNDQPNVSLLIQVEGEVQVACDRCLDPMTIAVKAEDEMRAGDELFVQDPSKPWTIDLPWLAYELIVVNLPLVHSHPEGGCNPQMAALLQDHLRRTEADPEEL